MIKRAFDEKCFIWLSNWIFLFVTLHFICATALTAIHYNKERKRRGNSVRDQFENGTPGNFTLKENNGDIANSNANSNNECGTSYNLGTRDVYNVAEVVVTDDTIETSPDIPMDCFHKAFWVIYNLASAPSFLVSITFWVLLFDARNGISASTIIVHGVNSIIMIGDTMLSSIPVRLFHVVYPMFNGVAYTVFTVVYWAFGGTNSSGMPYIYPQTDYTGRPVTSAVSQIIMFFVALPLCHGLMFGLYCLRVWLKTKRG